MGFPLVP